MDAKSFTSINMGRLGEEGSGELEEERELCI